MFSLYLNRRATSLILYKYMYVCYGELSTLYGINILFDYYEKRTYNKLWCIYVTHTKCTPSLYNMDVLYM